MLATGLKVMNEFDFLHRELKQFGRSYTVQFAVDRTNKRLFINELTILKLTGQFPPYRSAVAQLLPSIANHPGQWFDITDTGLTMLRPVSVANWLIETVELLKRFYLPEPGKSQAKEDKASQAIIELWE